MIMHKTITFQVKLKEKTLKLQLNFDSPRTKYISKVTGVSFLDCIQRPIEEFQVKGVRDDVINLRYQHHYEEVGKNLLQLYTSRRYLSTALIS
jgi:hypothetical protein